MIINCNSKVTLTRTLFMYRLRRMFFLKIGNFILLKIAAFSHLRCTTVYNRFYLNLKKGSMIIN